MGLCKKFFFERKVWFGFESFGSIVHPNMIFSWVMGFGGLGVVGRCACETLMIWVAMGLLKSENFISFEEFFL